MTMPPSPPCDRCGQPVVEAHYPDGRCPRPPRGARKGVAVSRAIAGVILLVGAALVFLRANGTREVSLGGPMIRMPTHRSELACARFKKWEASAGYAGSTNTRLPGNMQLLQLAVRDAHSGRVQLPTRLGLRLETDMNVLWHGFRQGPYAGGRPTDLWLVVTSPISDEKRIEKDCSQIVQLQG